MGPKKWPVAEAYSADFHAPSVVSISKAFARIQGGRHKGGCLGRDGGGGEGRQGEGDAQQGLIPATPSPNLRTWRLPSRSASPCQR